MKAYLETISAEQQKAIAALGDMMSERGLLAHRLGQDQIGDRQLGR
jgi:hypothetical protein